jgi:hypothetical protein
VELKESRLEPTASKESRMHQREEGADETRGERDGGRRIASEKDAKEDLAVHLHLLTLRPSLSSPSEYQECFLGVNAAGAQG